jgi:hypothetical protein
MLMFERGGRRASGTWDGGVPATGPTPGRRTLTASLQRKATAAPTVDGPVVHAAAQDGVRGGAQPLPHLDAIQASFGPAHDLSRIEAHTGADAAAACTAIDASAYASGDSVAFAGAPALHTAAHEAAHVVQQAQGVHLYGGLGEDGDAYERAADAVADRVVAGQSAADLLGAPGSGAAPAVQRKAEYDTLGLDYQGGGTFTSGSTAHKEIAPGSGPRFHITPEEVPAMLSTLLASEDSKEKAIFQDVAQIESLYAEKLTVALR